MIDLEHAREVLKSETPDCGDNSCRFALKISGMRTNGGCRCIDRSVTKATPVERYAVHARVFLPAALDEIEGLRAAYDLTVEELKFCQQEVAKAHMILSEAKIPTNGAEGDGKRQTLSVSQRIERALADNRSLREQLGVAVEALKFYVARSNVPIREIANAFMIHGSTYDALAEYTKTAREALRAIEEKSK